MEISDVWVHIESLRPHFTITLNAIWRFLGDKHRLTRYC
jgi:hypothetical protein